MKKLNFLTDKIIIMDKTIKQLIRETNANGIKDIVWNEAKKRWVVTYFSKYAKPSEYKTLLEVVQMAQPEPGH